MGNGRFVKMKSFSFGSRTINSQQIANLAYCSRSLEARFSRKKTAPVLIHRLGSWRKALQGECSLPVTPLRILGLTQETIHNHRWYYARAGNFPYISSDSHLFKPLFLSFVSLAEVTLQLLAATQGLEFFTLLFFQEVNVTVKLNLSNDSSTRFFTLLCVLQCAAFIF